MSDTPFIRVKDKRTKHQYDVHEQRFDPEIHEALDEERFPRVRVPRRTKPHIDLSSKKPASSGSDTKTSASKAVEGASPATPADD